MPRKKLTSPANSAEENEIKIKWPDTEIIYTMPPAHFDSATPMLSVTCVFPAGNKYLFLLQSDAKEIAAVTIYTTWENGDEVMFNWNNIQPQVFVRYEIAEPVQAHTRPIYSYTNADMDRIGEICRSHIKVINQHCVEGLYEKMLQAAKLNQETQLQKKLEAEAVAEKTLAKLLKEEDDRASKRPSSQKQRKVVEEEITKIEKNRRNSDSYLKEIDKILKDIREARRCHRPLPKKLTPQIIGEHKTLLANYIESLKKDRETLDKLEVKKKTTEQTKNELEGHIKKLHRTLTERRDMLNSEWPDELSSVLPEALSEELLAVLPEELPEELSRELENALTKGIELMSRLDAEKWEKYVESSRSSSAFFKRSHSPVENDTNVACPTGGAHPSNLLG